MPQVTGHDIRLYPVDPRSQHLHGAATPVDQGAVGDVRAHAGEDLVQAIQGKGIVEFGDEDMCQQACTCHVAGGRPTGRGHLQQTFATAAGFLGPGDLDDLQLRRDQSQHLADILAHQAQITAAIGAATAEFKLLPLARRGLGYPRTAARRARGSVVRGLKTALFKVAVRDHPLAFGGHDQQILQRQFQLLDLALDPFRRLAEDLFLQLGNAQPQGLDQRVMRAQRGRDLGAFQPQGGDQRLQKR